MSDARRFHEDFATAWRQRYGRERDEPLEQIAVFLRHRSVRRFSDTPMEPEVVTALFAAAQSSSTSSNLQLWSAIRVTDRDLRLAIAHIAADQAHVVQAPLFLVFLADHYRLRQAAMAVGESADGLTFTEFELMAVIDAALAAERLVCAAEYFGLGACYVGAVRNDVETVARLLELPSGVAPLFGLCVGEPALGDEPSIKPRLSQTSVFFENSYPCTLDTAEYDDRMRVFYESQKMKGSVTWSMRSGRRVGRDHLHGRAILKQWLAERGFGIE